MGLKLEYQKFKAELRQGWQKAKDFYQKYSPWSLAVSSYLGVMVLDWVSSLWDNHILGVYEGNPFARNALMHFALRKALVVDAFWLAAFSFTAYLIYEILKVWNPLVAKVSSAGLFAYFALDRLLGAVVTNFLFALHLYVGDKVNSQELVVLPLKGLLR